MKNFILPDDSLGSVLRHASRASEFSTIKWFMFDEMENDLGTSEEIARDNPELAIVMRRIAKNWTKIQPAIRRINKDLKKLKSYSPKY